MDTPEWLNRVQEALEETRSENTLEPFHSRSLLPRRSLVSAPSSRMGYSIIPSPDTQAIKHPRKLFQAAVKRFNAWTPPELTQHLEDAFYRLVWNTMDPLRKALGLKEVPGIQYELVGRYPGGLTTERAGISPQCTIALPSDFWDFKRITAERTEDEVMVLLNDLIKTIIGVLGSVDNVDDRMRVPWSHVLVINLSFLEYYDDGQSLDIHSRSRYVFLMTGDKRHIVLHDTKVPDEAKAIAGHRAVVLGHAGVLAKEYYDGVGGNY
ncbi:hypothetical protein F4776DRAFT_657964 [Hypoxylon sp. NC0597]|nr:hypothetical protein F4776DRAFT_657964 [Hypoxylon sp. NC0597]